MKKSLLEMYPDILDGVSAGVKDYVSSLLVDEHAYVKTTYLKEQKRVLIASPDEFILIADEVNNPKWNDVSITFGLNSIEVAITGMKENFVFKSGKTKDKNVLADIQALAKSGDVSGAYDIYKIDKNDNRLAIPMKNPSGLPSSSDSKRKVQKNSLGDWALGFGLTGCLSIPVIIVLVAMYFLFSGCSSLFKTPTAEECIAKYGTTLWQGSVISAATPEQFARCVRLYE